MLEQRDSLLEKGRSEKREGEEGRNEREGEGQKRKRKGEKGRADRDWANLNSGSSSLAGAKRLLPGIAG